MTTGVACPSPILQFFNNAGQPAIGGTVLTQVGGINTATYQDINLSVPLPNPIPLNSRGEVSNAAGASSQLFLTPNTVYTFTLFDANGNQLNQAQYVNGPQFTVTQIGQFLYPQTQGEINTGVVPTSLIYPPGDVRRYGLVCDSATDNTTALGNALAANAGYFPVVFYPVPGQFYRFTSIVQVPGNSTVNLNGATLKWTATVASGSNYPATSGGSPTRPGFQINGNNVEINGGGGQIIGPSNQLYIQGEIGIYIQGGALASARTNIRIREVTLTWWGYAGIFGQFTQNTLVTHCRVTGCGYIGIGFISAIRSTVVYNEVDTITPGTSSNAYGIIHSYDQSNNTGASRPGSGGETDPYSLACVVAWNFVHDIPVWIGINWHGGFDSVVHDNQVYNCQGAIALGSAPNSSGTPYGGQNMRCHHNVCDINQYNGSATTVSNLAVNSYGIVMNGGTSGQATDYVCDHNVVIGYGLSNFDAYSIDFQQVTRGVCSNNILDGWSGYGIYIDGDTDCTISGNTFGAVGTGASQDACIYSAAADFFVASGNMHRPQSGTAAHYGIVINTSGDSPAVMSGNDFDGAQTAPYAQSGAYLPPLQFRGLSDGIPTVNITTVTSNTISIAGVGYAREVLVTLNTSGSQTINTITGGFIGQIVRLVQVTNQTTTFSRSNAKLTGGSNVSLVQYSVLTLYCYALSTGTPQWLEVAGVVNNS